MAFRNGTGRRVACVLILASASLATSCTTIPKQSDYTFDVSGDYKAVADCAYLRFRDDGWRMTDLSSTKTVEFLSAADGIQYARIEISASGPSSTHIASYQPPTIWGKNHWANHDKPIFLACAKR